MMGSLADLQKQLRIKDERIKELEKQLRDRDTHIQELKSELDKFQSVLPISRTSSVKGPRKQRAIGLSAAPLSSIKDSKSSASFKRHNKTQK